jgi:ubiquinone/menaquinone biosynthesis C-methylase UbiE
MSQLLFRPLRRAWFVGYMGLFPQRLFERLAGLNWYGGMLRAWLGCLHPPLPSRVLEVGCSTGVMAGWLAAQGHEVTGVDRSRQAIRWAMRNVVTKAGGAATPPAFRVGDAYTLPFAADAFDYAIAASLLNIVGDPLRLIREMARVTAPQGRVSFLFPTPAMTQAAVEAFIHRYALQGFSAEALRQWQQRAPKLAADEALALLKAAGLEDREASQLLEGMVCMVVGRRPASSRN